MTDFRIPALAAALTLPSPAWAEVCDKERPLWEGAPVTAIDEALNLTASPVVWFALAITLIAAVIGWRLLWAATALFWLAVTALILSEARLPDPTGIREFTIAEGCIGPPDLALATTTLFTLLTLSQVFKRRSWRRA